MLYWGAMGIPDIYPSEVRLEKVIVLESRFGDAYLKGSSVFV